MDLHWRTNLMTFLIFVASLIAIGLVIGGLKNAWDCCVMETSCTIARWLQSPVLLLLVLTRKSTMSPDLSASVWRAYINDRFVWKDYNFILGNTWKIPEAWKFLFFCFLNYFTENACKWVKKRSWKKDWAYGSGIYQLLSFLMVPFS